MLVWIQGYVLDMVAAIEKLIRMGPTAVGRSDGNTILICRKITPTEESVRTALRSLTEYTQITHTPEEVQIAIRTDEYHILAEIQDILMGLNTVN